MNLGKIFILVACGLVRYSEGREAGNFSCMSPRNIEYGTTATINCSFPSNFQSLLWYDPTDPSKDDAVLIVQDNIKKGRGFYSGEFDVYADGSLIIKNVTLHHEGTFTALLLQTPTSDALRFDVEVFVFGPTFSRLPQIVDCSDIDGICFLKWNRRSNVSCIIKDTRPAVPLSWMIRTTNGDQNVTSHFSITNQTNSFFTSRVTTADPFKYSSILALLVCIADGPPGLLVRNESLALIQNSEDTIPNVAPETKYVKIGSKLEMKCSGRQITYLVWQVKNLTDRSYRYVSFASYFRPKRQTRIADYNLNDEGSLVLNNVKIQQEGVYRCISFDGFDDDIVVYKVVLLYSEIIGYPVVNGCNRRQDCVIKIQPEGNLTCTVRRILPPVKLNFRSFNHKTSKPVSFYDKNLTVKENGDTFDVTLTSKYIVRDDANPRITIECAIIGSDMTMLNLSTKVDLLVNKGAASDMTSQNKQYYWFLSVLVIPVVLFLAIFIFCKLHSSTESNDFDDMDQIFQKMQPASSTDSPKGRGLRMPKRKVDMDFEMDDIEETEETQSKKKRDVQKMSVAAAGHDVIEQLLSEQSPAVLNVDHLMVEETEEVPELRKALSKAKKRISELERQNAALLTKLPETVAKLPECVRSVGRVQNSTAPPKTPCTPVTPQVPPAASAPSKPKSHPTTPSTDVSPPTSGNVAEDVF